ncbi:metallophosphoesterase [Agrobacterium sp. DSM 25558]|uniref:metallophosphoesterase n=1 Tax=Agrobacterium sp. DSM 25558 TaxID=1907665 RepID=UPI001177A6DB
MQIGFCGDSHDDFPAIRKSNRHSVPAISIFLGDLDLERQLDEEIQPIIDAVLDVHWIHGNHDTDREQSIFFQSGVANRNLSGWVVDNGVRIAGLEECSMRTCGIRKMGQEFQTSSSAEDPWRFTHGMRCVAACLCFIDLPFFLKIQMSSQGQRQTF